MRRLQYLLFLPFAAAALFGQSPARPPASQTTPAAAAQNTSPTSSAAPVFNATTRNVVLDVVVTDSKGHPVTGLTRNDFVIREDKAPQQVLSFDAVAAGAGSQESAPRTILLVDEMNTRFEDMAYVRYSVNRLLNRDGLKLDQPTALYILSNDGLHILGNYTRDPAAIDQALRRHKAVLSWRLQTGFYGAMDLINQSMTALQQIALANAGMPGHKNIVWISPGFPIFSTLQIDPNSRRELFDSLRRLSDQLLKARISIYSVDPRGVQPGFVSSFRISNNFQFQAYLNSLSASSQVDFGDLAIQTLAEQTGGHAYYGRNDVDREIASSITAGNTYYTLSYAPSNRNFDGKFRKIKISIINRLDLKIQTRDGYYAIPDGQPASEKRQMQELASSLFAPLTYTGVPIPSTYSRIDHQRLIVQASVATASLSWTSDAQGHLKSTISVVAARQDKHGHWQQKTGRVYSLALPDGATPSQKLFTSVTFEMPYSPSDRVRFVLRDDASGRIGSSEIIMDASKPGAS